MKIQIIGLGIVGTAQAYLSKELGHEVFGKDPNKKIHESCNIIEKYMKDIDITFICVPEKFVENIVKEIKESEIEGIIVIKSTVPVGTTKILSEKYNVKLLHNPEFLRENHLLYDVMNPSRIVIGANNKEEKEILVRFYKLFNVDIYITDSTTSEIIKLTSNTLRAINISFWNELNILCDRSGADISVISKAANTGDVIGKFEGGNWGTEFFGVPYGGKCLPKDTRHLIDAFRTIGLNPGILEATEKFNEKLKEKEI